jgi:hypothetical protein
MNGSRFSSIIAFIVTGMIVSSCSVEVAEEAGRQWGVIFYYVFWFALIVGGIIFIVSFFGGKKNK